MKQESRLKRWLSNDLSVFRIRRIIAFRLPAAADTSQPFRQIESCATYFLALVSMLFRACVRCDYNLLCIFNTPAFTKRSYPASCPYGTNMHACCCASGQPLMLNPARLMKLSAVARCKCLSSHLHRTDRHDHAWF
jgi:hypothetical protein